MADIDTMLAEVKRATAPVDVERVRDSGHYCCFCDGCCQNVYAGEDEQIVCDDCARIISLTAAPLLAAEVERLRAEVDRLTRDRDRLAGYVLAALPLTRDALTHIVEDRPEEAARTIFRIVCALASAAKEGVDQ